MASSSGYTAQQQIASWQKAIEDRLTALEHRRGIVIPFVDEDPSPEYSGNIWAFEDGRIRIRLSDGSVVQVGTATGAPSSGTPVPTPPPQPTTQRSEWAANWSQSYQQDGDPRSTAHLYYGYNESFNGRQTSLIGFPTSISTTLSGGQIKSVELYLYNLHSYWNNGSDIHFGYHSNPSEPSSLGGIVKNYAARHHFGKPQGKWVAMPLELGTRLRDGTARGVILQSPNNSSSFYGYAAGVGDGGLPAPRIRITYVK